MLIVLAMLLVLVAGRLLWCVVTSRGPARRPARVPLAFSSALDAYTSDLYMWFFGLQRSASRVPDPVQPDRRQLDHGHRSGVFHVCRPAQRLVPSRCPSRFPTRYWADRSLFLFASVLTGGL